MDPQRTPRSINHLAFSVPDIDAFIAWYSELLGFRLVGGVRHVRHASTPDAPIFSIYGDNAEGKPLREVKIAFLTTGNGVGVEVFQFVDPPHYSSSTATEGSASASAFDYNRGGIFHVCVTDPDPKGLVQRVEARGGRQIGAPVTNKVGATAVYFKDPWGNVVEALDMEFDRMAELNAR